MPFNMDEALLSSPDPLGDSTDFNSPPKRRISKARHSLPMQGSSPKKQTFELDVGNDLSPQKIRVTVEAGEENGNSFTHFVDRRTISPSPYRPQVDRHRGRTITTTIPVKGLSDTEDEATPAVTPRRGRGRPRKSGENTTATKKKGRTSTPAKSNVRRKSVGSLLDGDDSTDWDFQIGKGVSVGRGKGRSRSRSQKANSRSATPAPLQSAVEKAASSTTGKRGRRKTIVPEEIVVMQDENEPSRQVNQDAEMNGEDMNDILAPMDHNSFRQNPGLPIHSDDDHHEGVDKTAPQRKGGQPNSVTSESIKIPSSSGRNATYASPSVASKETQEVRRDDGSDLSTTSDDQGMEYELGDDDQEFAQEAPSEPQSEDEEQQEFDTILESEGFSMISVDSVPSLREHFSSPVIEEHEISKETPRSKSSLQITETVEVQNDSFSSIPNSVLEAATPAPKLGNINLPSLQEPKSDDSFSSIPAELFEAASPAPKPQTRMPFPDHGRRLNDSLHIPSSQRKSHFSRLLPNKRSKLNSSLSSSIAPVVESTPAPESSVAVENYEDSFSAIPPSILEAATPVPVRQMPSRLSRTEQAPVSAVPAPALMAPRLPTPEDTPSPIAEDHDSTENGNSKEDTHNISVQVDTQSHVDEASFLHSPVRSSPPSLHPRRFINSLHLHEEPSHPNFAATPSVQFSSPCLPPPLLTTQPSRRPSLPHSNRLGLSSAARAGQVLQELVVPSSPRSRSQSLGSPFKSPLTERRSSSPSRESQMELEARRDSRTLPLPRLDLANNVFANLAPSPQGRERSSSIRPTSEDHHGSSLHSSGSKRIQFEDPFSNNGSKQLRSPSHEDKQAYTLGLPGVSPHSNLVLSNRKPVDQSIMSAEAMSWQADLNTPDKEVAHEESNASNTGIKSSRRCIQSVTQRQAALEEHWASRRAATSREIESANKGEVVVINSDSESQSSETPSVEASQEERLEEDEDYELLLETINSSSPHASQQEQEEDTGAFGKPRRSRMPSPWGRNSNGSGHHDSASLNASAKFAVPMSHGFGGEKKIEQPATRQANFKQNLLSNEDVDMSSWSIPQKANFAPRVRNSGGLELSALLASPGKELPVLSRDQEEALQRAGTTGDSKSEAPISSSTKPIVGIGNAADSNALEPISFQTIPQMVSFRPRVRSSGIVDLTTMLNSPVKTIPVLPSSDREIQEKVTTSPINEEDSCRASQNEESFVITTESSSTPEPTYTPVPQKAEFRPQVREAGNTAMSEKFIISPVKPALMPKLFGGIRRNNLFVQPATTTKPLALASFSRTNSLAMGALSSPQRLSSAYSDEDSYVSHEKEDQYITSRTSQWCKTVQMAAPQCSDPSPAKSILRSPDKPTLGDDTPGKNVAWVSSSPSPSDDNTLLSATTWSNDHWELLKQIIEAWKPEGWVRDPTCPKIPPSTPKRRRSLKETRVVSKMLGKVIHSQGERMRLEQWHLEAVDEFREEVPGWEEVPICLRLFALIIGAERRGNGTVHLRAEMKARGEDPDKDWKEKTAAAKAAKAKVKGSTKGREREEI